MSFLVRSPEQEIELAPRARAQVEVELVYPVGVLGMWIEAADAGICVIHVMSGSAADKAGLVPGEVLTTVDGSSIAGVLAWRLKELVARPSGESVRLSILSSSGVRDQEVVLEPFPTDPFADRPTAKHAAIAKCRSVIDDR
ncbi:MAG: PDZ domain-containing protein [Deltaproteobacteria bacterium]|nr:PDZ domain-containing protein [Deltaproteobacteria bacterium]